MENIEEKKMPKKIAKKKIEETFYEKNLIFFLWKQIFERTNFFRGKKCETIFVVFYLVLYTISQKYYHFIAKLTIESLIQGL